jgi:hypothetical protein
LRIDLLDQSRKIIWEAGVLKMRLQLALAVSAAVLMSATGARADEGMWTFDAFPAAKMQAK